MYVCMYVCTYVVCVTGCLRIEVGSQLVARLLICIVNAVLRLQARLEPICA